MSNMLEWAKREVEIACKKENPNRKEGEFDYGCACYESALKAFESLCEDGHLRKSMLMGLLNTTIMTVHIVLVSIIQTAHVILDLLKELLMRYVL